MDNPTQGIDVLAKAEVYKLIRELAAMGKTILVNTQEIDEIRQITDSCIVFYHGGIKASLDQSEINDLSVMLLATGA